ncbi:MAG: preprotein translocase subunit SecE [Oscillospiraceae bacterium]
MAKNAEINSKASKSKSGSAKKEKKKGGIRKYFRDLKSEIKKVVWPTKKQVINNTGIVLTVMVIVGLFLAGIDAGLGAAVKALLSIGG